MSYKILLQRRTNSERYTQVIAKVRETDFMVNALIRECARTVRTFENIEAKTESITWDSTNINSFSFSRIEHFTQQFTSNFAKSFRYGALQSSFGLRLEAARPSDSFSLR